MTLRLYKELLPALARYNVSLTPSRIGDGSFVERFYEPEPIGKEGVVFL